MLCLTADWWFSSRLSKIFEDFLGRPRKKVKNILDHFDSFTISYTNITSIIYIHRVLLRPGVPDSLFCVRMSQHGLGLKKEGKKQNIDPVFNSSAVLFL
jgi:hypothetical protein